MTSEKLVDLIAGYRQLGEAKVYISPEEVYVAGGFAQNQICAELRPVEGICYLRLVANQERYQFSPVTITGATNASPVVVAGSHSFNTGDSVTIIGVLGNTAINGNWVVTKVDSTHFSADGSVGNGTYASGGTAYHALYSALELSVMRKVSPYYGLMENRNRAEVETNREVFGVSVAPTYVKNFYVNQTDPITIGVQGIPSSDVTVECVYYRKPLENLSSTVNPILPATLDLLLYHLTLYHALNMKLDVVPVATLQGILQKYEMEKANAAMVVARRNIQTITPYGLKIG